MYSYSPFIDWINKETPKPRAKLKSWPEKIPAMAVLALPSLAKCVMVK